MSTYIFSYFPGPITKVKPTKDLSLHEAMELIKSDTYSKEITAIRTSENKVLRGTMKKSLPYFTFSGTFTKRLTESLKKHSGLIVLDFDDLILAGLLALKEDVISIAWVCAAWISPSGNGLKVLVKINPAKHLESFLELADFFEANFSLLVDQSGKDVARACFVSSDQDLYYNPDAEIFEAQEMPEPFELVQEKSVRLVAKEGNLVNQFKNNKELRRVEHVVGQIERDKIDITDDDYDNRLKIGFALATLGEAAFDLYVRAIQFNDYDEDPREKFNDALKKGKFKTPAKFFSLAKDHGLSVSLPLSIQEAQKAADAKQVIGDEDATNDYMKYGIYENKALNTYFSLDQKGIPREISNFSLRILYHISTGADEAFRLMEIKNIHGLSRILRINTDDFVSAGSFKKVIARLGNYLWKGQDHDLVRLQDMLQREELHTETIDTLGWNKRGKFYAFANGIYDTINKDFLPIDKYGIVEKEVKEKKINYFLPALSMVFADKEDKYVNEKKFIYINSKVTYEDWSNKYVRVFKENGQIGLVYWACALFSDILFKAMGQRMPMPFNYGKRGSGKGTMIQSLTRMWGEKQDQIMLGGATTVVGFMRKMAQFNNGLVWLDEYKNNLPVKMIESIKNLFDRIGYERGKKDNGFSTESTPVLSAVYLSGQEMPTAEPALFTRCILLTFNETKRSEEDREEYRSLVRMEDQGCSHITVMMLSYRTLFEETFQSVYETTLRDIAVAVNNNDVDERLLGNYSMLLATAKIMHSQGMLPFKVDVFQKQCVEMILNQYFILKGSDDASKFWQVVEQLLSALEIQEDRHFMLKNGFVYIRIQDIYQLYVEAMYRRREVNVLDKPTLENYLQSDAKTFVKKEKKQFGGTYKWCLVFKYKELGIDLIKVHDKLELKAKYINMGLENELEELEASQNNNDKQEANDVLNEGFPAVQNNQLSF